VTHRGPSSSGILWTYVRLRASLPHGRKPMPGYVGANMGNVERFARRLMPDAWNFVDTAISWPIIERMQSHTSKARILYELYF